MSKVVYLDQNHWVTMARARVAPEKIQVAEERQAADALWGFVASGQVRLPLSMAHLVETAHAGTKDRRRHLAQAMLDAYGGWHMLNPLVVRRYEFVGAFSGLTLTAKDVFTTAANSPFFDYTPAIGVAVTRPVQPWMTELEIKPLARPRRCSSPPHGQMPDKATATSSSSGCDTNEERRSRRPQCARW